MLVAMSGDGRGGGAAAAAGDRAARVPPGPLADLKALVYELYLAAGTPVLDEIAAWIAGDDEAGRGARAGHDRRIIGDPGLPASQADVVAVVTVLARAARWDPQDAAGRARDLWVAARMAPAWACRWNRSPTRSAWRCTGPSPWTARAGFRRFPRTCRGSTTPARRGGCPGPGGASAMAVLVADSSAGKTRACWEALELAAAGGRVAAVAPLSTRPGPRRRWSGLGQVGPRTVVWLNETQEYLGGDGR